MVIKNVRFAGSMSVRGSIWEKFNMMFWTEEFVHFIFDHSGWEEKTKIIIVLMLSINQTIGKKSYKKAKKRGKFQLEAIKYHHNSFISKSSIKIIDISLVWFLSLLLPPFSFIIWSIFLLSFTSYYWIDRRIGIHTKVTLLLLADRRTWLSSLLLALTIP